MVLLPPQLQLICTSSAPAAGVLGAVENVDSGSYNLLDLFNICNRVLFSAQGHHASRSSCLPPLEKE